MSGGRRRSLAALAAALRSRPRQVAALAAWSAVQAAPALLLGRAVAGAADAFLAHRAEAGLAWLGVLVLAAAVGAIGSRLVFGAVADIVEPLRDELVRRVVDGALRRSVRPGATPDTGAVARLTSHVEIVRDTFAGLVTIVGSFLFTAGAALLGLLTLAPVAALVVTPAVLGALALFAALVRATARRQRAAVLADEAVAEAAGAAVAGLRDVVACGAEDRVGAELHARIDAQARAAGAVVALGSARALALALGGWLPLVAILLLAPWLLRRGVTAGALLGAIAYVRAGLLPALHSLVHGVGASGVRLAVTLDRIEEAAGAPPAAAAVASGAGAGARPAGHDLALRGVTFAYGPRAQPVIEDLDLVVAGGDHLAIVGPSGIGKSTLAGLLTGMLQPTAGRVLLGGVPIAAVPASSLPAHRVLIPQEAYVFAGTLRENLTFLAAGAGPEELDGAVRAVGLEPVVERVGGYGGRVDPAALSAGERQLVALTRAYLSPAPVAVLDEATCHLDPAAEARAERAFAARPGTLVVVAHRVSSALRARRVLVLDGARPALGTHQLLLEASPLYRDLVGHWSSDSGEDPAEERAS